METPTSKFLIKMDMAPATAFRGGNISEDSLATSTAILAAPYAVFQAESFSGTTPPSPGASWISENAEPMVRAMAVVEAARTLGFLLDMRLFTRSAGVGLRFSLRRKDMVKMDVLIKLIISLTTRPTASAASAPRDPG